jgi:hypothetical protein
MNGPLQTAHQLTATTLPAEFAVLAPPPLLLPGENLEHYALSLICSTPTTRSAISAV